MLSFHFGSLSKSLRRIPPKGVTQSHQPSARKSETPLEPTVPTHQQQAQVCENLHRLQQNYYLERRTFF